LFVRCNLEDGWTARMLLIADCWLGRLASWNKAPHNYTRHSRRS
jgi:hypothetical protein